MKIVVLLILSFALLGASSATKEFQVKADTSCNLTAMICKETCKFTCKLVNGEQVCDDSCETICSEYCE